MGFLSEGYSVSPGPCAECSKLGEYYMITNELWKQCIKEGERFLCLSCVTERLGRRPKLKDFTDCPVNNGFFGFNAKDWVKNKEIKYKLFYTEDQNNE